MVKKKVVYKKVILRINLSFVVFICLLSCKKQNSNTDYFVFGNSGGYCNGDCIYLFKISNGYVYPDNVSRISNDLQFKNSNLGNSKYQVAKKVKNEFPTYLKKNPNIVIGEPNSHDQGWVYIELFENNVKTTWTIDQDIDKQPVEIQNYMKALNETVENLK
jgi:hypothetical protein